MKNRKLVLSFVENALRNRDPFAGIDKIVQSKFMPRVFDEEDFQRLPEILKHIIFCRSIIFASGVTGLFGLFADSTINLRLDTVLNSVHAVSAKETLLFLQKLKANLPSKRFPKTAKEAFVAEELITAAEENRPGVNASLIDTVREFSESVKDLPGALKRFLIQNKDELVTALSGTAEIQYIKPLGK